MALTEYEIYIHNEVAIDTVTGFLSNPDSPAISFKDDKVGFLNYDGGTGRSNLDRIYEMYTTQEKEDNIKDISIELLKVNTELIVDKTVLNKELLSISGKNQFLEQADFPTFYGKSLLQLLSDPLYRPKSRLRYDSIDSLTTIFPNLSVWIFVGAFNEIINVTPYVMSCSISVTKEGGSFNIELPPVVSVADEDLYLSGDEFYSGNNIRNDITGENNEFYFHKYIQNNDIVFIKFEQLDIEPEERQKDFVLSNSVLSEQIYDMIGLVDTNSKSTNFVSNDVSISIVGRDFIKLIIDDGSYFIPLLFVENSTDVFVNKQDDEKLLQRTFTSGAYDYLYTHSLKGIASSLQFIINQLANIGVVDEEIDLFSSYGKRRTKVFRLDNEGGGELTEDFHTGVWQIIKLLVDSNVSDRRIADSSSSQPDGSLILQFQKLCQEPFVEFFGDTYGDFYNFIVRQPPYTKSQILSVIDGVAVDENFVINQAEDLILNNESFRQESTDLVLTVEPEDVISEELMWEDQNIYSWYELKPQGNFIGGNNAVSLAYIPIVYFPEYANKWGSRRLSHISNYISYQALTGKDSDINRDLTKEAVINDYKYMIDSHIYLPFTRKGSVTLNGDRRFKRGTWIRYGKEIFYVDAVSNNFTINSSLIDRTTTLSLSRGMVEKYLKGKTTYFNIVDTDVIRDILIEKLISGGTTKNKPKVNVQSNFGVNLDVFNFFYERQQME